MCASLLSSSEMNVVFLLVVLDSYLVGCIADNSVQSALCTGVCAGTDYVDTDPR